MKRSTFRCFIIGFLLMVSMGISAQITLFTEHFESLTIPTGWTQDPTTESTLWAFGGTGVVGVSQAYEGSGYAYLHSSVVQNPVKLVIPLTDVSSLVLPEIKFALVQPVAAGGVHDTLKVLVRSSVNASWQEVAVYSNAIESWSEVSIPLSDYVTQAGTLQVAFQYTYGAGKGIGIDRVVLGNESQCFQPTNLAAYRVSDQGAELMWNGSESALYYHLKISTTALSDTSLPGDVLDTVVYSAPVVIGNLSSSTTYYCYVTSNCGDGDVSDWSTALVFTTLCAPQNLPISEGFETASSGSVPNCWISNVVMGGDWSSYTGSYASYYPMTSTVKKRSGTLSMFLQGYYSSVSSYSSARTSKVWLVSPQMLTGDVTHCQVTFWMYSESAKYSLHVGLMSDPNDFSTFDQMAVVNASKVNSWEEFIVPFTAAADQSRKYVVYYMDGGDGSNTTQKVYIDDVVIDDIPACPKPSLIKNTLLGSDYADWTWTGSATTNYRVVLSSSSVNPDTATQFLKDTIVTGASIHLTGLQPETTYYCYIQGQCGGAGNSVWSNESSVTTSCAGISSFPYYENFDSYTGSTSGMNSAFPRCWTRSQDYSTSTNYPYVTTSTTYVNDRGLYFSSGTATYNIAALPPMDVDSVRVLKMEFLAGAYQDKWLEVGVMTNPNDESTFVMVDTIKALATGKQNVSVYFMNYHGQGKYLAFRSKTGGYNSFYIDDVKVSNIGTCYPPMDVAVSNVSSVSADVNWTPAGNGTNYRIKVSTSELENPSADAANVLDSLLTKGRVSLTNLKGNTYYYVYVARLCEGTPGDWYSLNFKTDCGIVTSYPFVDGFEDGVEGTYDGCWTYVYGSKIPSIVSGTSAYGFKNSRSLKFNGGEVMMATPQLGADIHTLQMSFYLAQEGANSGSMVVGVMSDVTDSATFEPIDTITMSTYKVPTQYTVYFDQTALSGPNRYVGFRQITTSTIYYYWLDQVVIRPIPTCRDVVDYHVESLRDTAATIRVDESVASLGYQVKYYESAALPSTAVYVQSQGDLLTLSNLLPETNYTAYIRRICGGNDTSDWSIEPVQFTTTDVPATLPYQFGFEDAAESNHWNLSNGSATNQWYIGSGTAQTGTKALYISDDEGMNNSYSCATSTTRSYVYASRTFDLPAGQIDVAFDWKAKGRMTYDYLVAFFVPSTIPIYEGGGYSLTTVYPFSSYSYSTSGIKPGWILLGGEKLNDKSSWQSFDAVVTIPEAGCYRLVYYWANYYSSSAGEVLPPAAIDNVQLTAISCGAPYVDQVTTNDSSATIEWTGFNGASSYDLRVSTQPWSGSVNSPLWAFSGVVNSDSVVVNGLRDNTLYYGYVRGICSATDSSGWSEFTFRTDCKAVDQIYQEGFEGVPYGSGVQHPCWTKVEGYSSYPNLSTSQNHTEGGKVSYYFMTTSSPSVFCTLASPYVNGDVKDKDMSFYTYYSTAGKQIEVGVLSDLLNGSTFVPIDTFTVDQEYTWEKHEVSFSNYTGQGHYIAFRTGGIASYNYIYVDDVEIREHRNCSRPSNVAVSRLKETEARVQWTSENMLSSYNLKVSTTPIDPESASGDVIDVTGYQDLYADVQELTPGTSYYAYVQSDCGDSLPSLWSDEFTFTTVCSAIEVPYHEYFVNDSVGEEALCWNHIVEKVGVPSIGAAFPYVPQIIDGVYYGTDSRSYKFFTSYEDKKVGGTQRVSSTRSFAVLPKFTASLSALQIKLNMYSNSANVPLIMGALSDPTDASSFEVIDTIILPTDWSQTTISLDKYQGTNAYLAFVVDASLTRASYSAWIDQVEVDSLQGCQAPVNLSASNVSYNSAVLSWSSVSRYDSVFNVQVSTFDAGLNTELMSDSAHASTIVVDTIVCGNRVLIPNLNNSTTYYYYVRSVCSDSTYSRRFTRSQSFTTACNPKELPFFEGFEDEPFPYDCWTRERVVQSGTTTSTWIRSTNVTYEGGGCLQLQDMAAGNITNLVTPLLHIDSANTYVLKLMVNRTSSFNTKKDEGVKIWVNQSPDTVGGQMLRYIHRVYSFTPVELNAGWYEYADTLAVQGDYYIIFEGISEYGAATYIDNVSLAHKNSCELMATPTVSDVTSSSLTLHWHGLPGEQIAVGYEAVPCGSAPSEPMTMSNGESSYTFTGLNPNSVYKFFVRNACSGGVPNMWSTVVARTLQVATQAPFVETFEQDSLSRCWSLVGANVNHFMVGTGASSEGSKSLYITDDDASNEYDISALSYAFAYRTIHLSAGGYDLSFNWKAGGDTYDFGRACLAPASFIPVSNSANGVSSSSLPSGWLSASPVLKDSASWTMNRAVLNVPVDGDYQLLFYWYNNLSNGTQPGLAVDSIRLSARECYTPFNLKTVRIMSTSADISVVSDASQFQIKMDSVSHPLGAIDSVVTLIDTLTTTSVSTLGGLEPEFTYYYWLRSICNNDTSNWQYGGSFTTGCSAVVVNDSLSYLDDFESYEAGSGHRPDCWNYYSTYNTETYPYLNSSWGYNSLTGFYLYNSSKTDYSYVVTPELATDFSKIQLTFDSKGTTDKMLRVGVMSDPYDYSTFEVVDSVCGTALWQEHSVWFDQYRGDGKYIGFAIDARLLGKTGNCAIDNVHIYYPEACSAPINLTADSVGVREAKMHWMSKNSNGMWRVVILPENAVSVNDSLVVVDTVVTMNPVLIGGLNPSTTYQAAIASLCENGDTSAFSSLVSFTTNCDAYAMPFNEDFSTVLPDCWERYTGLISDDVTYLSDLSSTTSYWNDKVDSGLPTKHMKLNIWGSSVHHWLMSPVIDVDHQGFLTFDLALTKYNKSIPIDSMASVADDKFMVLISTDGGYSWNRTNATIWSGDGTGDYDYKHIATHGEKITIDMLPYVGQSIRIAFYGESTIAGGDNDLHIDNVRLNSTDQYLYHSEVCDGYDYSGYGFFVPYSDLDITQSPLRLERFAMNQTGSDSVIVVNLTINPNAMTTIDASICAGDVYTENGFNATTSGQFRRTLSSASGCDSLIILNLTVSQPIEQRSSERVCPDELPYSWHGQMESAAGEYRDTLVAANGCDSVLILDLTVLPDYHLTQVENLSIEDLPYSFGDTIFTESTPLNQLITYVYYGTTTEGCDSVVTLQLTVMSTGVEETERLLFTMYPNPVNRDEVVYLTTDLTDAELQGTVVDVFNSVGECVKHIEPTIQPVSFAGFDASGVYMVRITTAGQRVVWKKLIVN